MSFVKDQTRLSKLTMDELVERMKLIVADPANLNPPGSFQIYKKAASRRMDAIAWAITYKLAEEKQNEKSGA